MQSACLIGVTAERTVLSAEILFRNAADTKTLVDHFTGHCKLNYSLCRIGLI